jgi:ABC-type branched-subunit amino acid transport system ATPase component
MMNAPILEINGLSKAFGGLRILSGVSMSLSKSSIVSLFGENGSGKTTLFHLVTGFLKADKGSISYQGRDITNQSAAHIAQLGIGRVWQSPRIFKNISVLDNLMLAANNHPGEKLINYLINPGAVRSAETSRRQLATEMAEVVALEGKLGETAGALSFGQQKLLSLGMLLMEDTELLLLDEPFAGVNTKNIRELSDVLLRLKARGKCLVLIEHNRSAARAISDRVFFLNKGTIHE